MYAKLECPEDSQGTFMVVFPFRAFFCPCHDLFFMYTRSFRLYNIFGDDNFTACTKRKKNGKNMTHCLKIHKLTFGVDVMGFHNHIHIQFSGHINCKKTLKVEDNCVKMFHREDGH